MGCNGKKDPVGIDFIIDRIQRDLFFELTRLGWTGYESYHRAYRNKDEKDTVPEVYLANGEYKNVLFDDKYTVTSFFLTDDKRTFNNDSITITQEVSIIFQARLNKLFKDKEKTDRGDERMIDNIRRAFNRTFRNKTIQEVVTGVDNVYNSLKIGYDKKYFDDLGDFSVARFNLKVIYTNTDKVSELQY